MSAPHGSVYQVTAQNPIQKPIATLNTCEWVHTWVHTKPLYLPVYGRLNEKKSNSADIYGINKSSTAHRAALKSIMDARHIQEPKEIPGTIGKHLQAAIDWYSVRQQAGNVEILSQEDRARHY